MDIAKMTSFNCPIMLAGAMKANMSEVNISGNSIFAHNSAPFGGASVKYRGMWSFSKKINGVHGSTTAAVALIYSKTTEMPMSLRSSLTGNRLLDTRKVIKVC